MDYALIIFLVVLGVVVDALVFERWGFTKDISSKTKILYLSGFAIVGAFIFFGLR